MDGLIGVFLIVTCGFHPMPDMTSIPACNIRVCDHKGALEGAEAMKERMLNQGLAVKIETMDCKRA